MKKLIYLIVLIVALAFIITGCLVPVVPPLEQNESGSIISKTEVVEHTHNTVDNDHKVKNKWDLKGNFVAHPSYTWGGLAEEATWEYSIHIKEAINGDYSVGSIRFTTTTGDIIEVIGHVKQTKNSYNYSSWAGWDTLAAAGTAEYNSETYNFIFLFSPHAMQFTISNDETFIIGGVTYDFDALWQAEKYFPPPQRNYDLHSGTVMNQFADIWNPKNIH